MDIKRRVLYGSYNLNADGEYKLTAKISVESIHRSSRMDRHHMCRVLILHSLSECTIEKPIYPQPLRKALIFHTHTHIVYSHCHCILCCLHILSLCGWRTWARMSTVDKGKDVKPQNNIIAVIVVSLPFKASSEKIKNW